MKKNLHRLISTIAFLAAVVLPELAFGAAQFQYTQLGDMILPYRKPGVGSYELVVNVGNVTNFEQMALGSSLLITNNSYTRLTNSFPVSSGGLNNLSWSVSSSFPGAFGTWAGYQVTTVWYTVPRTNNSVQSAPPSRGTSSAQGGYRQNMLGVGNGAVTTSSNLSSNENNTPVLIREPVWDGVSQVRNDYSYFVDNTGTGPNGSFGLPTAVEKTTPASFTSTVRSDLYRSRPTGFSDPDTGSSSGPAYFVGYFELSSSGALTFTRASATAPTPPPPPTITSITRTGNVSTVSFTTTNGANYSLYYNTAAGLNQPINTWSVSGSSVTGDGLVDQLSDTTTDANRIYRVGAQ